MRTLVLSDLHLGSNTGADVLRNEEVRRPLLKELARTDRLVLLGDVLELRHGPASDALAAAEPVLTAIGEALPADAEIVLVAGNHDHDLVRPWLDGRSKPLGLEQRVSASTASPLARRVAKMLGGSARVEVAYPGLWLRDDIYAFHGHYLDVHSAVPTFERLAAGVMTRIVGAVDEYSPITPDAYERVLAPMYAWIFATAQRTRQGQMGAGAGSAGRVYETLHGDGRTPVRTRVLLAALPIGVRGLSLLGLGDLKGDITPAGLLRGTLDAVGEAVANLGIDAEHVLFGHSHRAGPLRNDDLLSWRSHSGSWLHNTGCWVHEPGLTGAGTPSHPYWPGGAILIDGKRPPRLLRLLDGVKLPKAAHSSPQARD